MSEFRLLSAILRNVWLLDKSWADDNLLLVANIIEGKPVSFGNAEKRDDAQRVCVLNRPEAANLYEYSYSSGFDNAPEGSFAMIDLIGPVMKYGFCSDGSYEITQMIKQAQASANIIGIFLNIDSPGGQVDGTASLADAIKATTKPVVAFVNDGLMASAAMWIGSAADEIYASQELDNVGSIGVYTSYYDQRERLKQMGIKVIERYAPQSTEKNKAYKDALKNKFDLVDADLAAIADKFISTIMDNRGDRLNGDSSSWDKGQLMYATDAAKLGLIDGILSFEQAVARLEALTNGEPVLAGDPSKSSLTNNSNMKFPQLLSLAGKETPTQEELAAANAELTEAGITGVGLYPESVVTDAAQATTERDALQTQLTTATEKATELEGKLGTAATEIATLKAKVAKGPAAAAPAAAAADPVTEKTEAQKADEKVAGFAHNKYVNEFLNR